LNYVPKLYEIGLTVIDLSADFRLKNPEAYKIWYGYNHPYQDLIKKAVYGLPELHRNELKGAKLIAVPGCNATAATLSLIPLVKNKIIYIDKILIDVAKLVQSLLSQIITLREKDALDHTMQKDIDTQLKSNKS
jgi:N-acetyl-gamma-glutamyl-phosphate/LysW-gamma-L-alpha-aminoadipyl-6-phosphate reductase